MEVSGQLKAPAASPPGKAPRYSLDRRLWRTPKLVWMMWKREQPYPCWESNPGRPLRNPSLYWLGYPGSQSEFIGWNNEIVAYMAMNIPLSHSIPWLSLIYLHNSGSIACRVPWSVAYRHDVVSNVRFNTNPLVDYLTMLVSELTTERRMLLRRMNPSSWLFNDADCAETVYHQMVWWLMIVEQLGWMRIGRVNQNVRRNTTRSAKPYTTNHHMTWPGVEPDRRGGDPATNRLSNGTAKKEELERIRNEVVVAS
jgi:hypothetical protein